MRYEPVSYTHLDVYKRQRRSHAAVQLFKQELMRGAGERLPAAAERGLCITGRDAEERNCGLQCLVRRR